MWKHRRTWSPSNLLERVEKEWGNSSNTDKSDGATTGKFYMTCFLVIQNTMCAVVSRGEELCKTYYEPSYVYQTVTM